MYFVGYSQDIFGLIQAFDLLPVLLISNYKHVALSKKVLVKNMGPNGTDNVTNHSYGICFSGSHCATIFISITQASPNVYYVGVWI